MVNVSLCSWAEKLRARGSGCETSRKEAARRRVRKRGEDFYQWNYEFFGVRWRRRNDERWWRGGRCPWGQKRERLRKRSVHSQMCTYLTLSVPGIWILKSGFVLCWCYSPPIFVYTPSSLCVNLYFYMREPLVSGRFPPVSLSQMNECVRKTGYIRARTHEIELVCRKSECVSETSEKVRDFLIFPK